MTGTSDKVYAERRRFGHLEIANRRAGGISGLAGRRPPCAPHTTDRDEPSGGIITVATTGSAPPLVPRRSEHERRNDRQPAIWHRHRPLTPCHGSAAGHARGAPSQLPAPRRASQGMPMTRSPASPRRRQAAWAGGRAMRLTPTPTAQSTCGDTFGGPGARPLPSRAGAAGATACRRGLDGPHGPHAAATSYG